MNNLISLQCWSETRNSSLTSRKVNTISPSHTCTTSARLESFIKRVSPYPRTNTLFILSLQYLKNETSEKKTFPVRSEWLQRFQPGSGSTLVRSWILWPSLWVYRYRRPIALVSEIAGHILILFVNLVHFFAFFHLYCVRNRRLYINLHLHLQQ